jgi:colanic acid/amylovoran biosynthesis protein
MTHIVKELLNKEEQVVLMSFCEAEGDLAAVKRIQKKFSDCPRVTIFNHTNINESLNKIKGASKIIATRYHSMILGWLFKKPTFVISYSQKINNVINDLFPEQPVIDINQIDLDNFKLNFIVNNRVDKITRESQHQFKFLDRFLEHGEINE